VINRTACILCDRCVRGCGEVRGHFVLARARKGSQAHVAFDWDDPMGQSTCVRCGECFISCPTDAITMKPDAKPSPWDFEEQHAVKPSLLGWLAGLFGRKDGSS
jgi:predicted molibdopterin-dependent oxidoreductase YjgC